MTKIHPTMARLYEAAASLKSLSGQSELARALNMSPQRLNNWERRGISQEGANQAQSALGINATWILTGNGLMSIGTVATEAIHTSQHGQLDPATLVEAVKLVRKLLMVQEGEKLTIEHLEKNCTHLAYAYDHLIETAQGQVAQAQDMVVEFSKYIRAQGAKREEKLGIAAKSYRRSRRRHAP